MTEKQSNKDRIKEITAGIEQGIKELFESDRYRQYLSTMSRFHKYSLNNVIARGYLTLELDTLKFCAVVGCCPYDIKKIPRPQPRYFSVVFATY